MKQVLALRGPAESRGAVGASTCLSVWPLGGVGGEGGCMTPSLQLLSRFLADALLCSSGSPLTLKPFLGTTPEMYAAFPLHLLRDCKNKIRLCLGSAHRSHNDPPPPRFVASPMFFFAIFVRCSMSSRFFPHQTFEVPPECGPARMLKNSGCMSESMSLLLS